MEGLVHVCCLCATLQPWKTPGAGSYLLRLLLQPYPPPPQEIIVQRIDCGGQMPPIPAPPE